MTFRVRLTLAYLALLTLALSGFGIWVYAYVDRNLHQEFYVSVQRQGSQLAQVLASDYDAAANPARETLDQLTTGQGVDTYIVVERRLPRELRLDIVAKHPADALSGVDLPDVAPGQVVNVQAANNDLGLPLAVYATRFEANKAVARSRPAAPNEPREIVRLEGQVTVARSLAGVERSLRLLRTILIAGGLAVLVVAALIGLGLGARLLRPPGPPRPPPRGSATSAHHRKRARLLCWRAGIGRRRPASDGRCDTPQSCCPIGRGPKVMRSPRRVGP
jgi:hypothetical protein